MVEVTCGGKTRSQTSFAHAIDAKLTENFARARVADTVDGKPLAKVSPRPGDRAVKFHEDGYTDLRGRLGCALVNTPERQASERFSVLVLSEDGGALIREAAPPKQ